MKAMKAMIKWLLKWLLVALAAFIVIGLDPRLETTYYDYTSRKIPQEFEGFRIVQISDFHLKKFGDGEETLIAAVEACEPDIIVMTGDIVDGDEDDISPLQQLLEGIHELAPIYYVSGNHDLDKDAVSQYDQMQRLFATYGVTDLDDKQETIRRNNAQIILTGVMWRSVYFRDYIPNANQDYFNILLYHAGNTFDLLSGYGYDLLLAGHMHGGVVRLPFLGGLFGDDGTLFPEYDGGAYENRNMSMILSRGMGDVVIPRFWNRPELVCVELHAQVDEIE